MARVTNPIIFTDDSSGNPLPTALWYFYKAGTSTLTDTYPTQADADAGTNANSNPITANSRGETAVDIFCNVPYKMVLTTTSDTNPPTNPIRTIDNNLPGPTVFAVITTTSNYSVLASDTTKVVMANAASNTITVTLPSTSTVGTGFSLTIVKTDTSANTVTVATSNSEYINNGNTLILSNYYGSVTLVSDSGVWRTIAKNGNTLDANNNIVVSYSKVSTAVNYFDISNNATGSAPIFKATGSDTNVGMTLQTKGSGAFTVATTAGAMNFNSTNGTITYTMGTGTFVIKNSDSRTNTINYALEVHSGTGGTPATNIGVGVSFYAASADESDSGIGTLAFRYTDVTSGSEDSEFLIINRVAGGALSVGYSFRTTGTNALITTHANTADRTLTLPDASITVTATSGDSATVQLGAWTSFSPSFSGFSANPTVVAKYCVVGKTCFIKIYPTGDGTSNATTFSISNLPFTSKNDGTAYYIPCLGVDSGSITAATAVLAANATSITLYKGTAITGSTWTNSGSKSIVLSFFYEIA